MSEEEQNGTWQEDLKDLIRRKQAENVALRKIQESLHPGGGTKGAAALAIDEDLAGTGPGEDENQLETNENNHQ